MEYLYGTMLLSAVGTEVNEANITKVLEAAGVKVDAAKVKSLMASLDGVDITKTIEDAKSSFVSSPTQGSLGAQDTSSSNEGETKKEEEKKDEVDASAGLGSLF